jgi:hypothetical protein
VDTIDKYLRQSDFAEHIQFLNENADKMKRAIFIWENEEGVVKACGIQTGLSYIEAFGLIELGKQSLFDFMTENDEANE